MQPDIGLDLFDNFPGFDRAPGFVKSVIEENGFRQVADIGGGANPLIDERYVKERSLNYSVFDISEEELGKAGAGYSRICVDVTSDTFDEVVAGRQFDLVVSHCFLEHIKHPERAHRNFFKLLRPGGLAVHFYPSPGSLPLVVNKLLPEAITTQMLKIAQPERDLEGAHGKFPAYYAMCGPPSRSLHQRFNDMGYVVVRHTGYIGHGYYERFPGLASAERATRKLLLGMKVPLTSACLLVLQRP